MAKDKVNFYGPGLTWIIVKELKVEIIHEAIKGYMEDSPDGYWLKLYHFWNEIDDTVFDQLDPVELDELVQLNLFLKLDQLQTQLTKLTEIEESNKFYFNQSLTLLENFSSNTEKSSLHLDHQLALADKYFNFTKALLVSTCLLAIIKIFEIFGLF